MKKQKGFTLIELLVTLVLVVIVSGVMYALYKAQNQTTITQGHVADMQQTLRYSAEFLSRDIRMAGYDPEETGDYGVEEAKATSIIFTADMCENGGSAVNGTDCQEVYKFELYGDNKDKIRRKADLASGGTAFAENVEGFELCYSNGEDPCKVTPDTDDYDAIREVILSILVKSAREDSSYKNTITYKPGSHKDNFGNSEIVWGSKNDGYRRRMIVKRIKLRNMGL